jgi:hypothetical protein
MTGLAASHNPMAGSLNAWMRVWRRPCNLPILAMACTRHGACNHAGLGSLGAGGCSMCVNLPGASKAGQPAHAAACLCRVYMPRPHALTFSLKYAELDFLLSTRARASILEQRRSRARAMEPQTSVAFELLTPERLKPLRTLNSVLFPVKFHVSRRLRTAPSAPGHRPLRRCCAAAPCRAPAAAAGPSPHTPPSSHLPPGPTGPGLQRRAHVWRRDAAG